MRIGVIARADNRGLGIQTWEVARHLEVERVLVVREPGSERRGFHPQLDRFPGAAIVEFGQYNDGELDEEICRGWLDGLDVIYSAETLYDWRISGWAREAGCATVVHANPEFYKHSVDSLDHPTAWWSATPWRLGFLPRETRVVPMPMKVGLPATRSVARRRGVSVMKLSGVLVKSNYSLTRLQCCVPETSPGGVIC